MQAKSWWQERIIGALSSYWVYQHLGNLSPAELADNELYQQVREVSTATPSRCSGSSPRPPTRRPTAPRARAGPTVGTSARSGCWSSTRAAGGSWTQGRRSMLSDAEFDWIEEQLTGDYDHLLIGTSLPWLLPRAFHDIEAWNELLC